MVPLARWTPLGIMTYKMLRLRGNSITKASPHANMGEVENTWYIIIDIIFLFGKAEYLPSLFILTQTITGSVIRFTSTPGTAHHLQNQVSNSTFDIHLLAFHFAIGKFTSHLVERTVYLVDDDQKLKRGGVSVVTSDYLVDWLFMRSTGVPAPLE